MHVFLAGSTGALGRRIIPLLIGDGHEVTALTRRSDRAGMLRSLGAHPAVADVFEPESLAAAVKRAAPHVVMHQLTDLTSGTSASNADLRARGTRNLMDAARAAGVGRVISQSIAWAYSASCAGRRRNATGPRRCRAQADNHSRCRRPRADDPGGTRMGGTALRHPLRPGYVVRAAGH